MEVSTGIGLYGQLESFAELARLIKNGALLPEYYEYEEKYVWIPNLNRERERRYLEIWLEYFDVSYKEAKDKINLIGKLLPNIPIILTISSEYSGTSYFPFLNTKAIGCKILNYVYLPCLKMEDKPSKNKKFFKTIFNESLIIGNYSSEIDPSNILEIKKGTFHEVTLTKDGNAYGRGSNVNNQLEFPNKFIQLECGRLFTATLANDGKVSIAGVLKDFYVDLPKEVDVNIEKSYQLSDSLISRTEPLELKFEKRRNRSYCIVLDKENNVVGTTKFDFKSSVHLLQVFSSVASAFVHEMTTYSENEEERRKPSLSLKLRFDTFEHLEKNHVIYSDCKRWKDIEKIKAVDHGLLGLDKAGNVYFDGCFYDENLFLRALDSLREDDY